MSVTSSSCCSAWGPAPSTASSRSAWCSSTAPPASSTSATARWRCSSPTSTSGCVTTGSLQFPWVVLPHEIDARRRRSRPCRRSLVSLVYAARARARHVLADLPAAAQRDGADARLRVGRHDARAAGDRGPQLRHDREVDADDPADRAARTSAASPCRRTGCGSPASSSCSPPCWRSSTAYTRFGLATRASAENERGAALIGLSANRIGAGNWILATMLAGIAGHPDRAGLDGRPDVVHAVHRPGAGRRAGRALPVVRGRRRRRPRARDAAVGGHQAARRLDWLPEQGVPQALPFVLIMIAMTLLSRGVGARGTVGEPRNPSLGPADAAVRDHRAVLRRRRDRADAAARLAARGVHLVAGRASACRCRSSC